MDDSFTELMMKIGMQDLVERLWFMEIMIRIDAQVTQGLKYLSFFHKAEKRSQILPPFSCENILNMKQQKILR